MVKLLVCGPVSGRLSDLCMRVDTLNKSAHGPFDAVLCVGDFFARGGASAAEARQDMQDYMAGRATVPTPTYFINSQRSAPFEGADLPPGGRAFAPNLHFLGHAGVTELCGLRVAFLTGIDVDAPGDGTVAAEEARSRARCRPCTPC